MNRRRITGTALSVLLLANVGVFTGRGWQQYDAARKADAAQRADAAIAAIAKANSACDPDSGCCPTSEEQSLEPDRRIVLAAAGSTEGLPVQQGPELPAAEELGAAAAKRVAEADKYAFVFFFRGDDELTQTTRVALESAVQEIPDQVELVAVNVADPLENAIVNKFKVSRAPMPLIIAVAPTGAVTKAWIRQFDAGQLPQAFVSAGEASCLKTIQDGKLVLLCIQNDKTAHNDEAMLGVEMLTFDPLYAGRCEVVRIDPDATSEAGFLEKLRIPVMPKEAVTVLMAPPGRPIATFIGATSKTTLIATIDKAGSECDPSSGCCPPK